MVVCNQNDSALLIAHSSISGAYKSGSFIIRDYLYTMSKIKTAFFCSGCGYESTKWLGKCPSCNSWNTFVEEVLDKGNNKEQSWKGYAEDKKLLRPLHCKMLLQEQKKGLLPKMQN